jgi:hypothetical protein
MLFINAIFKRILLLVALVVIVVKSQELNLLNIFKLKNINVYIEYQLTQIFVYFAVFI